MAGMEPIIAGVAGRYATALFELARDNSQLEQIEGELFAFRTLLDSHEDLDETLKSPVHSLGEKHDVLTRVLKKAGITGLTTNFLSLVAKNNRLPVVRDIIASYTSLIARHRGEVRAQVISASKLSKEHKSALEKTLKSTLGQDVKIDTSIDTDLLGGLVVKIGSKMIDNSLRTKLNNLRVAMKEVS